MMDQYLDFSDENTSQIPHTDCLEGIFEACNIWNEDEEDEDWPVADYIQTISETSQGNVSSNIDFQLGNKPLYTDPVDARTNVIGKEWLTASSMKGFTCNACGKAFRWKNDMQRHERIHTGEKPFQCDICDRSFCQESNLKFHLQRHRGEKPYLCEVCGRCFTLKDTLLKHNTVHSGERPYGCDTCSKKFAQAGTLKRHHFCKHTDRKEYECPTCSSKFARRCQLTVHMHIHQDDIPFVCERCGNSYTRKTALNRHMERRHKPTDIDTG
eukprot:gene12984-3751_t